MSDTLVKLTESTLDHLPEVVRRPRYKRSRLTPGIVHIGVGNFHRAHQAWYTHRLMQRDVAMDWGIIGAGVRPYDSAMREKLKAQDWLTTLIELDPKSTAVEVTGSMIDYIPIEEGNAALINAMSQASIRIVSMTVTEGGYYLRADGSFDADHADMQHDATHPDRPRSAFGAIIAALQARRASGYPAFTMMSCDNLQGNGDILRQTVLGLADLSDPDLADWIVRKATFPNSMVDCIVPATGPTEIETVRSAGIDDAPPVTHEPFRHWVIEDKFRSGRPAWEAVGAIMTDDVHDFEVMKLRILNGGHQIVANAGELLGIETIAKASSHPLIAALFRKVQTDEILPQVKQVPGFTPSEYLALIEQRFANPRIVDTTRRVAFDGSSRHPGFILPSIRERLEAGAPVHGLALVEALWARMCLGTREDGSMIEPNDPNWDDLVKCAEAAQHDASAWLGMSSVYDPAIAGNAAFRSAFSTHLERIHSDGVCAVIESYL